MSDLTGVEYMKLVPAPWPMQSCPNVHLPGAVKMQPQQQTDAADYARNGRNPEPGARKAILQVSLSYLRQAWHLPESTKIREVITSRRAEPDRLELVIEDDVNLPPVRFGRLPRVEGILASQPAFVLKEYRPQ